MYFSFLAEYPNAAPSTVGKEEEELDVLGDWEELDLLDDCEEELDALDDCEDSAEEDDREEDEDCPKFDAEKDSDDDEPLKNEKKSKNGSELSDSCAEDDDKSSCAKMTACEDIG